MVLTPFLFSISMSFHAAAADLPEQFAASQQSAEAARVWAEEVSEETLRQHATEVALRRVAKRLSGVLGRRGIQVSSERLFSKIHTPDVDVEHAVEFHTTNWASLGQTESGQAEITVFYRSRDRVCRMVGKRRIYTSEVVDRLAEYQPFSIWISGPDCVLAPK